MLQEVVTSPKWSRGREWLHLPLLGNSGNRYLFWRVGGLRQLQIVCTWLFKVNYSLLLISTNVKASPNEKISLTINVYVYSIIAQMLMEIWKGSIRKRLSGDLQNYFPLKLSRILLMDILLMTYCCEFGAEVFVYRRNSEWESLAMVKEPSDGAFSYKMENFSAKDQPFYYSKVFTVGERNWYVHFTYHFFLLACLCMYMCLIDMMKLLYLISYWF